MAAATSPPDVFSQQLADAGYVFTHAPMLFVATALLMVGFGWSAGWIHFRGRIESLRTQRDALKDERDRWPQDISPAAQARIEDLERQVRELGPPRLSAEDEAKLAAVAARAPGKISITYATSGATKSALVADLRRAFTKGGWSVLAASPIDMDVPSGVAVFVNWGSPEQRRSCDAAVEALATAGLACDMIQNRMSLYDVQIELTQAQD